jgi:hypothetical protein
MQDNGVYVIMYKPRVKLQIGNHHVAASRQDMKPYIEGRLASQVLIRQHGLASLCLDVECIKEETKFSLDTAPRPAEGHAAQGL